MDIRWMCVKAHKNKGENTHARFFRRTTLFVSPFERYVYQKLYELVNLSRGSRGRFYLQFRRKYVECIINYYYYFLFIIFQNKTMIQKKNHTHTYKLVAGDIETGTVYSLGSPSSVSSMGVPLVPQSAHAICKNGTAWDRTTFWDRLRCLHVAELFAKDFSKKISKPLHFVNSFVLQLNQRRGAILCYVEEYVPNFSESSVGVSDGHGTKVTHTHVKPTAQGESSVSKHKQAKIQQCIQDAFAHFVFQQSEQLLLITSFKRIGAFATGFCTFTFILYICTYIVYTYIFSCYSQEINQSSKNSEPQVHSRTEGNIYGPGNFGIKAFHEFAKEHKCNEFLYINISKYYNLKKMPGVQLKLEEVNPLDMVSTQSLIYPHKNDVMEKFSRLREFLGGYSILQKKARPLDLYIFSSLQGLTIKSIQIGRLHSIRRLRKHLKYITLENCIQELYDLLEPLIENDPLDLEAKFALNELQGNDIPVMTMDNLALHDAYEQLGNEAKEEKETRGKKKKKYIFPIRLVHFTATNCNISFMHKCFIQLTNLQKLTLNMNCLQEIAHLQHCRQLKDIDLRSNDIRSLQNIHTLIPNVCVLNLQQNKVEDIGDVWKLQNLQVSHTRIHFYLKIKLYIGLALQSDFKNESIENLAKLTNLKCLGLDNNPISAEHDYRTKCLWLLSSVFIHDEYRSFLFDDYLVSPSERGKIKDKISRATCSSAKDTSFPNGSYPCGSSSILSEFSDDLRQSVVKRTDYLLSDSARKSDSQSLNMLSKADNNSVCFVLGFIKHFALLYMILYFTIETIRSSSSQSDTLTEIWSKFPPVVSTFCDEFVRNDLRKQFADYFELSLLCETTKQKTKRTFWGTAPPVIPYTEKKCLVFVYGVKIAILLLRVNFFTIVFIFTQQKNNHARIHTFIYSKKKKKILKGVCYRSITDLKNIIKGFQLQFVKLLFKPNTDPEHMDSDYGTSREFTLITRYRSQSMSLLKLIEAQLDKTGTDIGQGIFELDVSTLFLQRIEEQVSQCHHEEESEDATCNIRLYALFYQPLKLVKPQTIFGVFELDEMEWRDTRCVQSDATKEWLVPRTVILTSTMLYLCDEDYSAWNEAHLTNKPQKKNWFGLSRNSSKTQFLVLETEKISNVTNIRYSSNSLSIEFGHNSDDSFREWMFVSANSKQLLEYDKLDSEIRRILHLKAVH
ncbi:hypothetical protein RFI_03666 [Reticulomyxa filosa]|uniref:Alpha-type protein kinase domain-containing protein n=1 Tax=Reticulomyxa filosa TaxID=46433 RepID=X6P735_RETFI|nr:hypothetical protein RFI_03666 [Reticulomyxa filosa]|eukprot:ETO33442.1 hypothetical protein RFI_03666 [Reticulomyxa filosa]